MSAQAQKVVPLDENRTVSFTQMLRMINYPGRTAGAWTEKLCEIFRNATLDEQRVIEAILVIEQTQPRFRKQTVAKIEKGKEFFVEKDVRIPVGPQDVDRVRAKRAEMDRATALAIAAKQGVSP